MLPSKILYQLTRSGLSAYTRLLLKVNVEEKAPLPTGGKIIAANHPTASDPFLVAGMLKDQSHILITGQIFQLPVIGLCLHKLGHIPVHAGNGREAIDRGVELLRKGKTVVIFPEGALSAPDGGVKEAHTGVARLALSSGAPVIPVGIHPKRNLIRKSFYNWRGKRYYSAWYLRGPYFMTVGEPLFFFGNVEDRPLVRSIAKTVMSSIVEMIHLSERRMNRVAPLLSRQMAS